jgi:tetratricopeptide (TPR) repeat protein
VLALSGDLGGARQETEQLAVLLGATSPVPWIELGHAHELAHRYDEALSFYDRAAEVAPHDPSGPATGGMRAARWGEPELAEPRLEEALRRNPGDARLWHALGLARVRLRNPEGARLAYRSGLQADPSALENRVGLASVALLEGDAEGALAEYDALLRARPGFGDGWLGRAWALILLGRLDEAERAVQKAVTLGGDARVAARQRALVARLRRDGKPNRNQ